MKVWVFMMTANKKIVALLVLILVFCFSNLTLAKEESLLYRDFRKIPGVTQEEIVAIEALQKKYSKLTYGMLSTTETFMREDGSIGGYSALFCTWMSELFGITIVPQIYDWNELITGFESGKIDFTGELTATPERRQKYLMTDTFTERSVKAFRLRGSESMNELAKTRKLRFAFLEGTTTINDVISSSPHSIEVIPVETEEEAIAKLRAGEVDAFPAEEHGAAIFPDDIIAENLFPIIYSPISFSTAKDDLRTIISVLDKYLKNGATFHLIDLYNQGNEEYLKNKFYSQLTEEERAFIAKHKENNTLILLGAEHDIYPISFYNHQENQWQGIAFEVLHGVSELSGLKFKVTNKTDAAWNTILEDLETGKISFVSELIYHEDRKNNFLWTEGYALDYYALLSLSEHEDIGINQILYSKIGLIKDTAYTDLFKKWFPNHQNTKEYLTSDEGFAALERKEIDFLMATRNILLSATNYHEKPGFKANLVFDYTYESAFGFNKNEKILCSIFAKAQRLIDTKSIADRWTRKVFDYRGKLAREQVPYLFGVLGLMACVLGLLSFLFIRNGQMKKRLEITVKERTAELEVASQAKGDFLSRMSHEIRTPLNAIIGMAQIAKQSTADPKKNLNSINEIISASSHLLGILNDVLDMSKIEAGKFTLAREPFSLVEAIRDVELIIVQRANEKNINFIADTQQLTDINVFGDKLRLTQVLINLLGNAVKFTGAGGKIQLIVKKVTDSEKNITLEFCVRDSGIGMSEKQIEKLFVAFEQADNTIASRFGGTGLGLAISQNLVKQMGGEIVVESELNEGSSFSFVLTLEKAAASDVTLREEKVQQMDFTGKRILLVEDIEINRLIVTELLKEENMIIDEAEDGLAALHLFERSAENYYDLIFMDIQMPYMDGYETAHRIRRLNRQDAQTIPIVAMTANAYKEDIDRALAAGMDGHLSKPIDINALKGVLAEKLA